MPTDRPGTDGLRTFHEAVALVTGAASGIGAALARGLAARGARVILADRDEEGAQAEADRLQASGRRAAAKVLDVRDASAVEEAVAGVFREHGRLDYLFNNAGIGVGGEVRDLALDDWKAALDVNLLGPLHGIQAAYPRMVAQGFGHIVNTASMAAFMATALAGPYGATKSALLSVSRTLRVEAADHGVRVSVLCPGVVRTAILDNGGRYGRIQAFGDLTALKDLWERARPMDADVFAGKVLAAVARNRAIIIVPAWWRAVRLLNAVAPSLADAIAARELRRVKDRLRPRP
jgi:NADP-dependent 3-hydroxy acid dehydrogenase YdfG